MPEQDPIARGHNFQEVALGYTAEMAVNEANRCLNCKNMPCVSGCPVGVKIPSFIDCIKKGEFAKAYSVIRETNSLPAICGRVCPQENQCEKHCVRGVKGESVAIGRLERFAADEGMRAQVAPPAIQENGKRVAVIGLRQKGYAVDVFEALHTPGGVLVYGIPEFRLPKALVEKEIDSLRAMGVNILVNRVVGRFATLDELLATYDAAFIGSGAGLPRFQGIPGENLGGVYSANEFLTRINLMKAYDFPNHLTPVRVGKRAAVIGGGNVAMDAARCALRMGAEEVTIVYRRGEAELPARAEEIHHAKEEGIQFRFLTNPTEILGGEDGYVRAMTCVEMELGEPDASGRRRPIAKPGSEFTLPVDTVIVAIGNSPNPLIPQTTPALATQKWGGIVVEEGSLKTSVPRVYAGGDAVTGAATVILAMGAGKEGAEEIDKLLSEA